MRTPNLAPIACSLGASDFKQRTAWIEELARQHLRAVRREPLALHLTYSKDALTEVREMVRREQSCCSFLSFDLRDDGQAVRLTIGAPEHAKEAAESLFDHFAPSTITLSEGTSK